MLKIEDAIIAATKFHTGQVDKDGMPYIYHPLHVMEMLNIDDLEGRMVATLHDVVEDTTCTLGFIKNTGFSDTIVDAIDCITKRQYESYDKYLKRVKSNDIATRVKICDATHNLTRSELNLDSTEDEKEKAKALKRIAKYTKAIEFLS